MILTKETMILTKEITSNGKWQDLTFEEHLRAHLTIPPNCILKVRLLWKDTYRYNIYSKISATIIESEMIQVTKHDDGYKFKVV